MCDSRQYTPQAITEMQQIAVLLASPPRTDGAPVPDVHYGHLLADIERAARQTEPTMHAMLLFDVLSMLQRGGVRVLDHLDCVLAELD